MDGGLFGLQLNCTAVMVDGCGVFLLGCQEIAQVDVGASTLRITAQSLQEMSFCLAGHAALGTEHPPVHVRLGELRRNTQSLLKTAHGFVRLALAYPDQP